MVRDIKIAISSRSHGNGDESQDSGGTDRVASSEGAGVSPVDWPSAGSGPGALTDADSNARPDPGSDEDANSRMGKRTGMRPSMGAGVGVPRPYCHPIGIGSVVGDAIGDRAEP